MESKFIKLQQLFNLKIDAPYLLRVGGKDHQFQCRIRGYGNKNGMIVDKDWKKIEPVADDLVAMGFGFSCFEIVEDEVDESWREVLDDWGKI